MISAQEARQLKPKAYLTEDELQKKIIEIANTGLNYLWSDLTLAQVELLRRLEYKVEEPYSKYDIRYKISW